MPHPPPQVPIPGPRIQENGTQTCGVPEEAVGGGCTSMWVSAFTWVDGWVCVFGCTCMWVSASYQHAVRLFLPH